MLGSLHAWLYFYPPFCTLQLPQHTAILLLLLLLPSPLLLWTPLPLQLLETCRSKLAQSIPNGGAAAIYLQDWILNALSALPVSERNLVGATFIWLHDVWGAGDSFHVRLVCLPLCAICSILVLTLCPLLKHCLRLPAQSLTPRLVPSPG